MVITNIYSETDSHQMTHCETCPMPEAIKSAPGNTALYSAVKHAIMETRAEWDNPEGLEFMRNRHEEHGTIDIYNAALKCIRCAEGMCLLIDGRFTGWTVGGEGAVS